MDKRTKLHTILVYTLVIECLIVMINYFITNHATVTPRWFTALWLAIASVYEVMFIAFVVSRYKLRHRLWLKRDIYQMLFWANIVFLSVQIYMRIV